MLLPVRRSIPEKKLSATGVTRRLAAFQERRISRTTASCATPIRTSALLGARATALIVAPTVSNTQTTMTPVSSSTSSLSTAPKNTKRSVCCSGPIEPRTGTRVTTKARELPCPISAISRPLTKARARAVINVIYPTSPTTLRKT